MYFLSLITKNKIWIIYSIIIKYILIYIYKIRIGSNFYCQGIPNLKINGLGQNIKIGNNVKIMGKIDLRNREDGKIIIEDEVKIDENCRFVSAQSGVIKIGKNSIIGPYAIWNGGEDIIIGQGCIFSSWSSINANEHILDKSNLVSEVQYNYLPVNIEKDCFIGSSVSIHMGVIIKEGSIIGSNAVVTKNTNSYSINVGIPSKEISSRK